MGRLQGVDFLNGVDAMNHSNRFDGAILIVVAALVGGCASNPESNPTDGAQPASAQMYATPSTRPSFLRTDAPHGQYNNPLDQPDDSSE
jgi:hypothetical protein